MVMAQIMLLALKRVFLPITLLVTTYPDDDGRRN